MAKEKMYKTVGTWWNDNDIELVEIDGEIYALYGWSGEKFLHCWKCQDKFTEIGNEEYEITPIYDWDDEDCEIIGYEVF